MKFEITEKEKYILEKAMCCCNREVFANFKCE